MLRTLQIEIVYKGLREIRGLNQKKQEKKYRIQVRNVNTNTPREQNLK